MEAQKFSLLGVYKPFDPLIQSSVNINRYSYSGYTNCRVWGTPALFEYAESDRAD